MNMVVLVVPTFVHDRILAWEPRELKLHLRKKVSPRSVVCLLKYYAQQEIFR